MPDTKALKELLPEIEKQEGQWPDELIGRGLCAMHGVEFGKTEWDTDRYPMLFSVYNKYGVLLVHGPRNLYPDTDLTAADKLCGELGYERFSGNSHFTSDAIWKEASVWPKTRATRVSYIAEHPTNERTAICLALARALIAEGEG